MNTKIFDKIDDYFISKTKKEFFYTILVIAFLIGFVFFYFINPKAMAYEKENVKKFDTIKSSLKESKIQLNVFKIRKRSLEKELKTINKKLTQLNKEKVFYSQLANLLDFAQFNKQKWAQFIKNIVLDAKAEGMEVESIENHTFEKKDKKINVNKFIMKKMDIVLSLSGNYKNFIHYMYKYENMKPLIRVEDFKISDINTYYIKFSLYGYKQ